MPTGKALPSTDEESAGGLCCKDAPLNHGLFVPQDPQGLLCRAASQPVSPMLPRRRTCICFGWTSCVSWWPISPASTGPFEWQPCPPAGGLLVLPLVTDQQLHFGPGIFLLSAQWPRGFFVQFTVCFSRLYLPSFAVRLLQKTTRKALLQSGKQHQPHSTPT